MKKNRILANIISILLFTVTILSAGVLTTKVSNKHLSKGEELKVTITATGNNVTFPEFDKIGNSPVESRQISQNTEITYINGKLTKRQKKILNFSIFPDHNITLPIISITIDGKTYKTKPIQIFVSSDSSASHGTIAGYSLNMTVSKNKVFVGEPTLLQVVFFEPRNSQIAQAQYIAPKFDGFFVKSNNQERLEQTANGTAHIFDYILTPQKEGSFTISAPQIKIGIQTFKGANDPWGFFNNEVHWRNIRGNQASVTVLPLPTPADLVGSFTIKSTVDTKSIKANKPVNYTLEIKGLGSLEDMDEPKFDTNDVTVYSDDAQVKTEIRNGHIHSKWIKKYSFIADRDFTIPAIHKRVFNPKTGKTETISTQAYNINVTGGSPSTHSQASTPAKPNIATAKKDNPVHKTSIKQKSQQSKEGNRSLFEDVDFYTQQAREQAANQLPWWSLILAFGIGIIVTLGTVKYIPRLKKHSSHTKKHRYTTQEALDVLYPHTNDSPEIEQMVRDLYKAKNGENIKIDQKELQKLIASLG